jgi:hypothetical protein
VLILSSLLVTTYLDEMKPELIFTMLDLVTHPLYNGRESAGWSVTYSLPILDRLLRMLACLKEMVSSRGPKLQKAHSPTHSLRLEVGRILKMCLIPEPIGTQNFGDGWLGQADSLFVEPIRTMAVWVASLAW